MQTYVVTRTMQYTETIEVEAETEKHAERLSHLLDGVHNNDDIIIEIVVKEQP